MFKKTEVILNGEKLSRRAEARKCKLPVKNTSVVLAVEFGHFIFVGAFQVVLVVKNPPANAGDFILPVQKYGCAVIHGRNSNHSFWRFLMCLLLFSSFHISL